MSMGREVCTFGTGTALVLVGWDGAIGVLPAAPCGPLSETWSLSYSTWYMSCRSKHILQHLEGSSHSRDWDIEKTPVAEDLHGPEAKEKCPEERSDTRIRVDDGYRTLI